MNKGTQLIWGIASIVGLVVIALWALRLLNRFIFWLRFHLVPGLIIAAICLGIVYLGWVIFSSKEES